jgi:SM-20-related protein
MNQDVYLKIADALVDDGYIVIKNALNPKLPHAMASLITNEVNFKQAGISGSSNLHIDANRRRDKILWLEVDNSSQSEFLEFANGLREYLNQTLYLGLRYYESHFAIYDEGDFYEKHLDAFFGSKNRVVTTVYYLNEEWNENDGGELRIYDASDKLIKTVSPHANTLVVFLSDKFPHEVLPAKKKRYSIAGWFRIDKS